jgi:hypothetical protein
MFVKFATRMLRVWALALGVLLVLAVGSAVASKTKKVAPVVAPPLVPSVTIAPLPTPSDDPTPVLKGTAATGSGDATSVTVTITGGLAPLVETVPVLAGAWSLPVPELGEGSYSAVVTQRLTGPTTVQSEPMSFSVDLTAPALTLSTPVEESFTSGSSVLVSGHAGVAVGDLPAITVQVYTGATIAAEQIPLESIVVQASDGEWSVAVAGLATGTYTVRAEQSDLAGNLAVTAAVAFQVLAPAPPPALAPAPATTTEGSSTTSTATANASPAAAFTWLPLQPRVGERVSLLSTSTVGASPLASIAWATVANGPFTLGGPASSVRFKNPGMHPVGLRVIAADGLSSTVSHEVSVLPRALALMDPFPVVQLAGTYSPHGIDVKLLRVEVPLGAHVLVSCEGRDCPLSWEKYKAAAGQGKLVSVEFHGFERAMPVGVAIRVMVSEPEEIGKLTRIFVRAGRPPMRLDTCVSPAGGKQVACHG